MRGRHGSFAIFGGLVFVLGGVLIGPHSLLALFSDTDIFEVVITDLEPGDQGRQLLALPVVPYDAYACMDVTLTSDDDRSSTAEELAEGDAPEDLDNKWDGELVGNSLVVFWWADDGDGVYEGENGITDIQTLHGFSSTTAISFPLAVPELYNIWGVDDGLPIPEGAVRHIGMAWCLGEALGHDDNGQIICDGNGFGNLTQTDGVSLRVALRSVQAHNNEGFTCANPPALQSATLTVIKEVVNGNGGTKVASDFSIAVSGTNVSLPTFPGSETGTAVNIAPGAYTVSETIDAGYTGSFGADCSGIIVAGDDKTCIITNDDIGAAPVCCSSVLFLPGIGGSRLYIPGRRGGIARIWEPLIPALFPFRSITVSNLSLNENGSSKRADVTTKDIVDRTEWPDSTDIYDSFQLKMDALARDRVISAWEAIPYDWRLSLEDILTKGSQSGELISYLDSTSTPYVIQELRKLAADSKTGKVTIIAHSNGGLVTKRLIEKLGQDASKLIDKIVFVAVPQIGTPQGVAGLLHGYAQSLGPGGLLLSESNARSLAQNMPVAYNLLPSAAYFSSTTNPLITFDDSLPKWIERYGNSINTFEGLQRFLTDTSVVNCNGQFLVPCRVNPSDVSATMPATINAALLSNANDVHTNNLDNWQPPFGVEFVAVAGWGTSTLSQIKYKPVTEKRRTARGGAEAIPKYFEPQFIIDGDGTIVVSSALWTNGPMSTRYWMNLSSYNALVDGSYDHGTIFAAEPVQDLLEYIIKESHASLPTHISTSSPGDAH